MIEPSTFVDRWLKQVSENIPPVLQKDCSLICVAPEVLVNRSIPEISKRFLIEAGLPKSAAPHLSLDALTNGLQSVCDIWGVSGDWNETDRLRLSKYCVIGSEGSGNPLCIDETANGNIVVLEHENWFSTEMFVNTGVPQLAEFLLLFNSVNAKQQIVAELEQIDPSALKEGCFWRDELNIAGVQLQ